MWAVHYLLFLSVAFTLFESRFCLLCLSLKKTRTFILFDTNDKKSSEPFSGRGEWPEWDQPQSLEEEFYTFDENDQQDGPASTLSASFMQTINTINAGRGMVSDLASQIEDNINKGNVTLSVANDLPRRSSSDSGDWKGWSEEPPYFDEDDVQDDEGNWGRNDESSAADSFTSSSTSSSVFSTTSSSATTSEWERFTGPGLKVSAEPASKAAQPLPATTVADSEAIAALIARIDLLERKIAIMQSMQIAPQRSGEQINLSMQLAFLAVFLTFQVILVSKL